MYSQVKEGRFFLPVLETGLAAADTLIAWVVKRPIQIKAVAALVTTVLGSFTSVVPILAISYTVSGGTIAEKDTITLVAAAAVGTEIEGARTSIPFDCLEDGTLTFAVKTAGSGGTTTGQVAWIVYYNDIPHI